MSRLHGGGTKLGSVWRPCHLDNHIHHWHGSYARERGSRHQVQTFSLKPNVWKWLEGNVVDSFSLEEFCGVFFFVKSETFQQMIRLTELLGNVHICACVCILSNHTATFLCTFVCVCAWVYRMCVPKRCQPPHPPPKSSPPTPHLCKLELHTRRGKLPGALWFHTTN